MGVEYRDVPGFPGYRVGNDGSLWSQWRRLKGNVQSSRGGYRNTTLRRDGKDHWRYVHSLVLLAFVGPRPDGMEARHLDGDPLNNRLSNLCWGTHAENGVDMIQHGRSVRGERSGMAKLTESDVRYARLLAESGKLHREIAAELGVGTRHIGKIVRREIWAWLK